MIEMRVLPNLVFAMTIVSVNIAQSLLCASQ